MARFRFSIASLLVVVLVFGLAFAALRGPTDLWDSALLGLDVLLLLTAILFAVHRDGDRRAYWLGFALFGWSYFGLCQISTIESRLPTTTALAYLDSQVSDRPRNWSIPLSTASTGLPGQSLQALAFAPGGTALPTNTMTALQYWKTVTGLPWAGSNGNSETFVRIGHSILVLVLALLGASLSRYLHVSGRARRVGEGRVPSPASTESIKQEPTS